LVDALEHGDPDAAVKIMAEMLRHGEKHLKGGGE
jgi:pentatricopeptide repeat protein